MGLQKIFFSAKILSILTVAVLILPVFSGIKGADAQSLNQTLFPVCERQSPSVVAWDNCSECTTVRCSYKSVSVCYYHAALNRYIYRYDYFTCTKSGPTYVLTPFNCSGALVPICNDNYFDVFNRHSGTACTLSSPAPVKPMPGNPCPQ